MTPLLLTLAALGLLAGAVIARAMVQTVCGTCGKEVARRD